MIDFKDLKCSEPICDYWFCDYCEYHKHEIEIGCTCPNHSAAQRPQECKT